MVASFGSSSKDLFFKESIIPLTRHPFFALLALAARLWVLYLFLLKLSLIPATLLLLPLKLFLLALEALLPHSHTGALERVSTTTLIDPGFYSIASAVKTWIIVDIIWLGVLYCDSSDEPEMHLLKLGGQCTQYKNSQADIPRKTQQQIPGLPLLIL